MRRRLIGLRRRYVCIECLSGWVWCVSSGVGAGIWDCCYCVWVYWDAGFSFGDVEVRKEAEGEDVLVVHASGEHDWQLYCCVDGVQRCDAAADLRSSYVAVVVADGGGCAGDCVDDGLLQAEVCSAGEGCGVDQEVGLGRSTRLAERTPTAREVLYSCQKAMAQLTMMSVQRMMRKGVAYFAEMAFQRRRMCLP